MTPLTWRRLALAVPALALLASTPLAAQQYFGRNKVQYETFDWRILRSDHFDNYFYPAESLLVHDAARMAERWYTRQSELFRHAFDRKSLIWYADHPDFQQTNVIFDQLSEGTGGVTEGARTRVIMPFTGVGWDNDHVLGHELVHVFQYNIAEGAPGGGLQRLGALPLWLIEGMAEYISIGRDDPLTAMWMRDAVMRDKFPTIKQLTTDPRFFPYRYGQAFWAYVAGRWGDRAVVDVFRTSLRLGWEGAITRVLGMNSDSLSKVWAEATRETFLADARARTHPDSVGATVIPLRSSGDYNVSPVLSADGRYLAYIGISARGLYDTELLLADAQTGRTIKKLASPQSDAHFDALSFISSAGDFSPDGNRFAFITYAGGNNELAIVNTGNADIERKFSVPGIGAISHVTWSPDGRRLALSAMKGGASDLYLVNLDGTEVVQLTNDRYADLQPAWSPDGNTLVFSSDRGPGTDFGVLKFGELQIATIDVGTRQVRVFSPFNRGKHLNPQWAPNGQDVYFIGDPDGVADVYRLSLGTGAVSRVTRVATGISGITRNSPALTVARGTGRVVFSIFKDQGQTIHAYDAAGAQGEAVTGAPVQMAASILPPADVAASMIERYLADATTGLPSGAGFTTLPYKPAFALDWIGQPSLGVYGGSGPYSSGISGGISGGFGDQLGDQQIAVAIQAQGQLKDIGALVQYTNLRKRWNWGASAMHYPYLTGYISYTPSSQDATDINYIFQRIYIDQAQLFSQYPLSTTRRFEFGGSATRLGAETEVITYTVLNQTGQVIDQRRNGDLGTSFEPEFYAEPSAAYVGDWSQAAFTSPVRGGRFRFEYRPTFGTFNMQTATADYRRYFFFRPATLAFRGMHLGRYGKDAENARMFPLYLGEETWLRGYGYGSFRGDECTGGRDNQGTITSCPVLDRMFGSRVIIGNAELRIPVLGTPEFGLINFPFLPLEVSPFIDAGVAYTGDQGVSWRVARNAAAPAGGCGPNSNPNETSSFFAACAERIPVFSTGVSFRMNVLGYMIFEAYVARPFQRPTRDWVWGFQLAPGW